MSLEKFVSSSVWRAKMKTYFKLMDVDKNGVLTLSDYEEIANRLIQLQSDSSKDEEIRKMCRSLFQSFMAGGEAVDDNTKVTEEDLIAKAAKMVSSTEPSVLEVGRKKNEIFFDIIDTDHSGQISRQEYRKYLAVYTGVEQPDHANQAFDSIGSDKSGSISREEFVEAHIQYWFEPGDDRENPPLPYGLLVDS